MSLVTWLLRSLHRSVVVGSKVFFSGGRLDSTVFYPTNATLESIVDIYDDETGNWTFTSLPVARAGFSFAQVYCHHNRNHNHIHNHSFLVAGGKVYYICRRLHQCRLDEPCRHVRYVDTPVVQRCVGAPGCPRLDAFHDRPQSCSVCWGVFFKHTFSLPSSSHPLSLSPLPLSLSYPLHGHHYHCDS